MHEPLDVAYEYVTESRLFAEWLAAPAVDVELCPVGLGEHNANFSFTHPASGQKLLLRVNYVSQMGLEHQIAYEHAGLRALEMSGRVPRALFVDDTRQTIGHGVLVMEFLEGSWLDYERAGDVSQAAAILADIHSVPVASDCGLLQPANPLAEQFAECLGFYDVYLRSPYVETRVTRVIDECIARTRTALEAYDERRADANHIINTEAIAAHFLIPADGSPGHMVDWEKPLVAEPAQDVAYFLSPTTTIWDSDYIFDASRRAAFVEEYWACVDGRFSRDAFDAHFDAYVRSNCLRGLTWCTKAVVDYRDPDTPLTHEKTRRKLDIYLSDEFLAFCLDTCYS